MIQELISTLTEAGLHVQFTARWHEEGITACVQFPGEELARGVATAKTPERALALAATRGLSSIYHRMKGGFISLEEHTNE